MKRFYFLIFISFFSLNSFGKDGKTLDFIHCKREVAKYRSDYAKISWDHKNPIYSILGIPNFESFLYSKVAYRPWLSKKTLVNKIKACEEIRSRMEIEFNGPRGIESESRKPLSEPESNEEEVNIDYVSSSSNI